MTPKAFDYQGESASDFVDVITHGGLTLRARCQGGAALEVQASTTVTQLRDLLDVRSGHQRATATLDPGETFIARRYARDRARQRRFRGRRTATVVTIEALAVGDSDDVGGTTNDCGFSGVALAG